MARFAVFFAVLSMLDLIILIQTKNPYPNVDATSGCVLYHYGLKEFKVCHTVPQLIMARSLSISLRSTTRSSSACRAVCDLVSVYLWTY